MLIPLGLQALPAHVKRGRIAPVRRRPHPARRRRPCSRPGAAARRTTRGHDHGADDRDWPTRSTTRPGRTAAPTSTAAGGARGRRRHSADASASIRSRRTSLVFETNCGSFTVTLDQAQAPATSASLVSLAKAGFYDETIFHRIVPGLRDPGRRSDAVGHRRARATRRWTRLRRTRSYTKGVVAMAKTEAESAGTSGSQFFVVTGADIGAAAGLRDRRQGDERAGRRSSGSAASATPRPSSRRSPVVIESVTVEEP